MAAQQHAVSRHSSSSSPHASRVVEVLLKRYGRSYCDELGIHIERNTPSVLFRWLCATILFNANIKMISYWQYLLSKWNSFTFEVPP